MTHNDELLARFEREYMEVRSVTRQRRIEQLKLLRKLGEATQQNLDELTSRHIREFAADQLESGYNVNTVRKHLIMFRAFLTWALEAGVIDEERDADLRSVRNPRGSSGRSTPNPYTVEEIAELRRRLSEKYPPLPEYGKGSHAMRQFLRGRTPRVQRHLWRHGRRLQFEAQIALALELGLRRIEIYRLSIPAMHYDNDQVVVVTAKQGPGVQIKRVVPYTTHARNCVQEWLDFRSLLKPSHDFPWLSLDNTGNLEGQLSPQRFDTFRRSLTGAFGKEYRWHRLRHTAATEWLRSGVPMEKVQIFMGHGSIEQTRQYIKIVQADIDHEFGLAEADFAKRLGLAA